MFIPRFRFLGVVGVHGDDPWPGPLEAHGDGNGADILADGEGWRCRGDAGGGGRNCCTGLLSCRCLQYAEVQAAAAEPSTLSPYWPRPLSAAPRFSYMGWRWADIVRSSSTIQRANSSGLSCCWYALLQREPKSKIKVQVYAMRNKRGLI